MSALPSTSSLRNSRSSSTFASHTSDYDPSLVTRRASSEGSMTLLHSPAVADTLSKKSTLSPSSSAQSSLSLATSVSSSAYSSASSPQPSTSASTVPQSITAESVQLKDDGEAMGLDLFGLSPPRLKKIAATPPPSIHHNASTETRPPSSAGSGSTSTPSLSEHSRLQPLAPLYFGDYLFPEHPSIQDLRHVFILDKSSKQKDFRQSLQLHAHLMGLALSARVSRGLDLAYDHAHDAFKNRQRPDRRNEFIATFNFTYDEADRILNHALAHPQPRPSFLDMMSPSYSTAVLTFLHRIRTDHSILATAFGNLQSQELDALLLPERPSVVLPSQTQLRGARDRGFNVQAGSNNHGAQPPPANHAASTQQRLQQQAQGIVPNFVNNQDIVHIILTNLFGPTSFEREHALRTQAVASICVTLLTEKKGERLMTEMMERYVVQSEWQQSGQAKAGFEETLLDIIRRGDMDLAGFSDEELNANVLPYSHHQSHHQSLGRMFGIPLMRAATIDSTPSAQIHHGAGSRDPNFFAANADTRTHLQQEMTMRQAIVEEFFTEACLDILDTLAEFSPPCLMELSRMIFAKLDQSAKPYASLIIVVKFFFYRFMNKCIGYPETYGMIQDVFVSERQRQRILFTTHQRLYRYITTVLNPVPGWESRSGAVDARIREKIESFISIFSSSAPPKESHSSQYTLNPIAESSTPFPMSAKHPQHSTTSETNNTTVTPVLLVCPSDFTTLFYFVCPNVRTATSSSLSSTIQMTRSSSFNGKSNVAARQRAANGTNGMPTLPSATKLSNLPSATRTHKRASPSFSFFSNAAASLPFKAKPPPPLTLEKVPSAPAGSSIGGSTFISLSGINPGHALSRRAATVELTSTSVPYIHSPDFKGEESPTKSSSSSSSLASHQSLDSPPVVKHWSDESLLPDLKAAIQELKKIQPGPIKEMPWPVNNPRLTPLREPWALAYVQYSNEQSKNLETGDSTAYAPLQDGLMQGGDQTASHEALAEAGLALAPPCMAMVMENSGMGGGSRIVTVTKPMLVDQVMDSAGSQNNFESTADLDLEVHESDNESLLSSEDCLLSQGSHTFTAEDKEMSILRVSSSEMLSSTDESGTRAIPSSAEHGAALIDDGQTRSHAESSKSSGVRRAAADRAWKARIRQTVNSESDLPEDIRTVARSIFKILWEFDVHAMDDYDKNQWSNANNRPPSRVNHTSIHSLLFQGIDQARRFGNHAAAIGFHHSLRVLESSPVLRQLDSSKIIYLLAMPIKHRLENREGRSRSRTIWEGFAHSWHMRLVSSIERKRETMSSLRVKMYYQTCVRTSRTFEKSLGVIAALGRLNRHALSKYHSAEEWDKCNGIISGWSETELRSGMPRTPVCETVGCKGSCIDHSFQNVHAGEGAGHRAEATSRRYSAGYGHPYASRASKTRRRSFSSYIDNMTSRSFGPSSFMESSLGHLKETEQASFASSYNSGHQGMQWSGSNGNQAGSFGSPGEPADVHSDFHMGAREVDAVQRWITETGIHSFLPGEDNFLRFCMEVESVVRGIGLGGTGIQGAGIPQAQNGTILPTLSSSGGDFFVKEVAKYNGQFVAGMGPTEQVVQPKSGGASGVAEFLVNSFKNGHAASSVPNTSGGYFFSHTPSSANSANTTLNSSISGGSSQPSQSSIHSAEGGSFGGRSKVLLRQAVHNNHQGAQEAIPVLYDDPSSIYAHHAGPTYALYNPPYSTTSHGTSSSYSGSMAPGGSSSTVPPHQISQLPKDMSEFLRRVQLKLTSFVLSEWLEVFGEVETDRWFMEFLDEMGAQDCKGGTDTQADAVEDSNQDGYILPLNQMDVRDRSNGEKKQGSTTNMVDLAGPGNSVKSSLHGVADSAPQGSSSSWQQRSSRNTVWGEDQSPQPQQQRQVGFDPETKASNVDEYGTIKTSASASTSSTARSLKDTPSLSSIFSAAAAGDCSPSSLHGDSRESTFSALDQPSSEEASVDTPRGSGRSLLNVQVKNLTKSGSLVSAGTSSTIEPYDLAGAYRCTVEQFNSAKSPYQKLGHLFALELLIVASLSYPDSCTGDLLARPKTSDQRHEQDGSLPSIQTRASGGGGPDEDIPQSPRSFTPGTDAIVEEIETLFRRPGLLRPRNLLRDMQLIAVFIPGSILDLRDDGKAFWDMALAISSLKSDVVEYIVQKGTQYVEVQESSRTNIQEADRSGSRHATVDDDERVRMTEAVRLFTIGAKESHPIAQRELAILYMSLPILPSSSSPHMGYKLDGSPLIVQTGRVPSPVPNVLSTSSSLKLGKIIPGRAHTPPPPHSPKGTFSSSFLGKGGSTSSTASSIPIKQKTAAGGHRHHQHSSSGGSGSSFGSGVWSGLGIMTGLGSFTGSSSMGSGGSGDAPNNSSTASLHQNQSGQQAGMFMDGHHDVEQYLDANTGARHGASGGPSYLPHHYPHHHHQGSNQVPTHPSNSSGPDKFNPENVAAAMHWFTLAAAQGDKFSINFLKHKETAGGMLGNLG